MSRSRLFGQPLHVLLSKSMRQLSHGPGHVRYRTPTGQVVGGTPVLAISEERAEPGFPHVQIWQVFATISVGDDSSDALALLRHFQWDHRRLRESVDQFGSRVPLLADVTYSMTPHSTLLHWLALCAELPLRLPSLSAATQPAASSVPTIRGLRLSLALPWHDSAHHWRRDDPTAAQQNHAWETLHAAIAAHQLSTTPVTNLGDLQETWDNDTLEPGGIYANRPPGSR